MKRPAFQFYPADWRKDAAVQACSIAARGLWHEMLCVMHECTPYGHLIINGKPCHADQLARLAGVTPKECKALLSELEQNGVFSRSEDDAIYSRRMVRDEHIRKVRAEAGSQGGNPNLVKQNSTKQQATDEDLDKQASNLRLTPSSSSSSSSSSVPIGTGASASPDDDVKRECFRLAKGMKRPSAPTELLKAGRSWPEIQALLMTAKTKGDPPTYLAKVLHGERDEVCPAEIYGGKYL